VGNNALPTTIETTSTSPADDLDVRCLRCEYNLRGLDRKGNCPECGQAIEPSWQRYELQRKQGWVPLRLASPTFLRRMGWGCVLYVISGCLAIASIVISLATQPRPPLLLAAIGLAVLVMMPCATWVMGESEPTSVDSYWLRLVIKAGCSYWFLDVLFSIFLWNGLHNRWSGFWRFHQTVMPLLAALITWAVWRRLAILMRRADRLIVWRWAVWLSWVWCILFVAQSLRPWSLLFRRHFSVSPDPTPVVGEIQALAFLPYSLIEFPRLDWSVFIATAVSVLTILTLALLAITARILFGVFRRESAHGE
jgi:hypothetical protein